jgi:serine protease Do
MLSVIRNGQEKTFHMTAGSLPAQREADAVSETPRQSDTNVPKLGITVTQQRGNNGVAVSKVDADGPAADRGLKNGDVILEAGGRPIATVSGLRNAIDAAQKNGRHSVLLRVRSGNETTFVAVRIDRG